MTNKKKEKAQNHYLARIAQVAEGKNADVGLDGKFEEPGGVGAVAVATGDAAEKGKKPFKKKPSSFPSTTKKAANKAKKAGKKAKAKKAGKKAKKKLAKKAEA
jgi:hypothetical protein